MIWGKQKLQREKIDKLHAQWFMTKDYLHMITFYSLSTLHVNPALRTAEKRHFHLERKQYQEFSHFGKEWYSHSFTYAPSAWKLNTIQNSFTDFKKCNADLINGNTGKINTLLDIYKRNENSLQLVFFSIQIIQTAYILGESKNLQWNYNSLGKGLQNAKDLEDWQVCWTAGRSI